MALKPRAVPWKRIPLPYQFFGRIRKAELACPACGAVHILQSKDVHWDPLRSRFKCKECGRQYDIGILAWPTMGPRRGPALDTVLVPKKAPGFQGALYARLTSLLRTSSHQPVNYLTEPPEGSQAPGGVIPEEITEEWDPKRNPDPGDTPK